MIRPALVFAIAVAAALALRHRLVEPAALAQACDAAPWAGWPCALRGLTIEAFVGQRIGILAAVMALAAWVARWRALAWPALAAAGAGLVLYSADWSAPAALAAALALLPPQRGTA